MPLWKFSFNQKENFFNPSDPFLPALPVFSSTQAELDVSTEVPKHCSLIHALFCVSQIYRSCWTLHSWPFYAPPRCVAISVNSAIALVLVSHPWHTSTTQSESWSKTYFQEFYLRKFLSGVGNKKLKWL